MRTKLKSQTASVRGSLNEEFRPNVFNLAFFIPAHILGISLWPLYLLLGGSLQWQEVIVFVFMWLLAVTGVNLGYHRSMSHQAYKMNPFLKLITLIGGASSAEGSALMWCSDHRRHHSNQDREGDPYNIKRGFWWAHMGWILGTEQPNDFSNSKDLASDPLIQNQHQYYHRWMILSCFALPLSLGLLLGRPLECFLLAALFRLVIFNHTTFLINSYAHYFGRRPYSRKISARDSLTAAVLTNGEGWHNFHHRFPWDYRNGHRFYHYDLTKWIIQICSGLGLVSHLKKASSNEIYKAKVEALKEKAHEQQPNLNLKPLSIKVDVALARWNKLVFDWNRLKKRLNQGGLEYKNTTSEAYKDQMKALKKNIKEARGNFKRNYAIWKSSLKTLSHN
jgi:stearoyl-CoA desaturase (delta-9 desaturase)